MAVCRAYETGLVRIASPKLWDQPHVFGVIRDDQEVERTDQLGLHTVVCCHLLTARHTIGIVWTEIEVLQHPGVGGVGCVQVSIAPEHALRGTLVHVGRIFLPWVCNLLRNELFAIASGPKDASASTVAGIAAVASSTRFIFISPEGLVPCELGWSQKLIRIRWGPSCSNTAQVPALETRLTIGDV
jgi:hypothetical protein